MSEKLLVWLGKRRQSKVVQLMQEHLALTTGAVDELTKAVASKIQGDEKTAEDSMARVSRNEEEADRLRRDISLELTKGEIPPVERDDLLHLSRRIDWVTDWSREAARILSITPVAKMPEELAKISIEMVELVKKCAWTLRKCINKLTEDPKETLKLADEVERLEEVVDEKYVCARKVLPKLDYSRVNPGEAILLSELLDAIENIADWCENSIDQARVVAVRLI